MKIERENNIPEPKVHNLIKYKNHFPPFNDPLYLITGQPVSIHSVSIKMVQWSKWSVLVSKWLQISSFFDVILFEYKRPIFPMLSFVSLQ